MSAFTADEALMLARMNCSYARDYQRRRNCAAANVYLRQMRNFALMWRACDRGEDTGEILDQETSTIKNHA